MINIPSLLPTKGFGVLPNAACFVKTLCCKFNSSVGSFLCAGLDLFI